MKIGTSNVEKVPGCCPGVPPRCTSLVVWLFATIGPDFPSTLDKKSFFFCLIKLWLSSPSSLSSSSSLIVDVHVSEFRYLVDTDMIRGKKKAISCNLIVDPPQGPRDAAR